VTPGEAHSADDRYALELRGISKQFGRVRANHEVDIKVSPGEIRGLVGENGAGKSTLMSIASGLIGPDAGQILIDGVERNLSSREDAIRLGINMVHQHFMLVANCTVAQNVALGGQGGAILKRAGIEEHVVSVAAQYGIEIDPRARISDLTPTDRQRVEIVAALSRGRRVLILDEPTSVLGPNDVTDLFGIVRRVAEEGCAVIFTSHKLKEVVEICDSVSVMRHGELQTTVARGEIDVESLAALMVGKRLAQSADASLVMGQTQADDAPVRQDKRGSVLVRISDAGADGGGETGFGDLEIASGEIVGVAGVEGNGQLQLAETIAGLVRADGCRVELAGEDITDLGPRERAQRGLGYVPEDPNSSALIGGFPVTWNLSLRDYRQAVGRRRWTVDLSGMRARAAEAIKAFDIRGADPETRTASLSGGNQQKVVLARELERNPRALVIVDPTVGLDVGAAQGVHRALLEHRDRGAAIVLISTDLDEIEALSDRIAVLYRGSIVGIVARQQVERRAIGLMMTGLSERVSKEKAAHAGQAS
jgi:general nucleoside transport system ATP-binding protein